MTDKTAVCVDCGQTDLREHMIKSPRGFIHTFTRRCQNTWQSRAEAAERRVQELEAQLAAQAWRPVTEPPPLYMPVEILCNAGVRLSDGFVLPGDDGEPVGIRGVIKWRPIDTPTPQPPATEYPPAP